MTDKYDEFIDYLVDNHYSIKKPRDVGAYPIHHIRIEFEEKQDEKQKEKQIKKAIAEVFNTIPLNEMPKEDCGHYYSVLIPTDIIDGIYQKLKQEELIK